MRSWLGRGIGLVIIIASVAFGFGLIGGDWWGGQPDQAQAGLFDDLFGGGDEIDIPLPVVPPEYAAKQMPPGYWTDPQVIEEGRQIFMGLVNPKVKCAKCHGEDGKPLKKGARDFRAAKRINHFPEDFWFWRISEGVPKTKMKPWKEKLTEEQRWKVMAFEHTFSHGGKAEPHTHPTQVKR